jgi:CheY-like chemotaxis protein
MNESASPQTVVLVVEDEAIVRINAIDMLEDAGFATLEAADAEDALALIESHAEISILFTDINMPGRFDGLELARLVHERRPEVRLIMTSGRQRPQSDEICKASRFIAKPYSAASLMTMVRAAAR